MNNERQFGHDTSKHNIITQIIEENTSPRSEHNAVVATKYCPRCQNTLPLEDFYRHKGRGDGHDCYCGPCRKKIQLGPGLRENNRRNIELHRQRYPEKEHARKLTQSAVRKGTLKKLPCQFSGCESLSVQAHHEDYSKPLEVVWLCRKHHNEYHLWLADSERFLDETFRGAK